MPRECERRAGSRARRTAGTCPGFDIVIVDGLRSVSRVNEPRAYSPNNSCARFYERRRIIASYGNVRARARTREHTVARSVDPGCVNANYVISRDRDWISIRPLSMVLLLGTATVSGILWKRNLYFAAFSWPLHPTIARLLVLLNQRDRRLIDSYYF